jgi:hypothetical protein
MEDVTKATFAQYSWPNLPCLEEKKQSVVP